MTGPTADDGVNLYRGMTTGKDGLPALGSSARTLGARADIDIIVDEGGLVQPGMGGISVAPNDIMNLPAFRRPSEFAGTGKDPVWQI